MRAVIVTRDEAIRALASTRTDLNKARLIIQSVPGAVVWDEDELNEVGQDMDSSMEHALANLENAVERVNTVIKLLGGKA